MEWLGYKQPDLTEGLPRGWMRSPIPFIWCWLCPTWQGGLGERAEREQKKPVGLFGDTLEVLRDGLEPLCTILANLPTYSRSPTAAKGHILTG